MATIRDLPTELVNNVASYLIPDFGIEAFALSCKTIYEKCQYTIDKHNQYRRKYRKWTNRGPRRGDILYFLYELTKDPLIAEYVEILNLWDRREETEITAALKGLENSPEMIQKEDQLQAIENTFRDTVEFYVKLGGGLSNMDKLWDQMKGEHKPNATHRSQFAMLSTLVLLMLLPNLRELGLHPAWMTDKLRLSIDMFWEYVACVDQTVMIHVHILYSLVFFARYPDLVRLSPGFPGRAAGHIPLAKLETLTPYNVVESPENLVLLANIEVLLMLPNLRNIYSISSSATSSQGLVEQRHWTSQIRLLPGGLKSWPSPVLRRLEIAHGNCQPEYISSFLKGCQCLEVFKYGHRSLPAELRYGQYGWDANTFVRLVGESAQGLKEFALRLLDDDDAMIGGIQELGGVDCYQALENLEIDISLFVDLIRLDRPARSLAEMLPESIRKVSLNVDRSKDPLTSTLVDGLKQVRIQRLKELEMVVMNAENDEGHSEAMQEARREAREFAKAQGVIWRDLTSHSWRSMGWLGDFESRFCPHEASGIEVLEE